MEPLTTQKSRRNPCSEVDAGAEVGPTRTKPHESDPRLVRFCELNPLLPKWRSASSPWCWRARCPWRRRRLNRMRPGSSLRSAATTAASETIAASPFRRRRRACVVERIHTACADRRAAARWAPRASRAETSGSARKHRTSRAQASAASVATTSCASACTTRRTTITILHRPSRRCCSC